MDSDCQFTPKCPIFNKFKNEVVREFWTRQYCSREGGSRCARKKLRDEGKGPEEVPITLLPNGMHLADLQNFDGRWERRTEETCEYLEAAMAMFNRFQDTESRDFWAQRYCFVWRGSKCERRRLIEGGAAPETLPSNLMPNGDKIWLSDDLAQ